ncbi:hypothetical protein DRF59_16510 [Chryseobacterium flavum]|uniref:TonB-dependent receptor plug domain-containing protein n=1 Tax=Chryseobacterium flavum TaxID=415851 RepID=A0A3D9CHV3_9FLAO|nr:hypothetical protein [Chryseobacterium flavum]REC65347.1 hypothetical protein DRF59_16510 [Chryseobacterium flavum]
MKITIPKPCHENWEMMAPEEKGRFCSVCSKTVYDFTALSDQELINAFSDQEENVCGRFNEFQLNRDLQYSFINALFIKFAVGFVLTAGGFVSVNAQEIKPKEISVAEYLAGTIGKVVVNDSLYKRKQIRIGAPVTRPEAKHMIILDNKNITKEEFSALNPERVESVSILQAEEAVKRYGYKGKEGVIIITTKKKWKSKK